MPKIRIDNIDFGDDPLELAEAFERMAKRGSGKTIFVRNKTESRQRSNGYILPPTTKKTLMQGVYKQTLPLPDTIGPGKIIFCNLSKTAGRTKQAINYVPMMVY